MKIVLIMSCSSVALHHELFLSLTIGTAGYLLELRCFHVMIPVVMISITAVKRFIMPSRVDSVSVIIIIAGSIESQIIPT